MKRIVFTGAAGALGTKLTPLLRTRYNLVLTDIRQPEWLSPDDVFVRADLRDMEQLRAVFRGADGVIHFGAMGDEGSWADMLSISIDGTYNVYEAARLEGVSRIVYSSSVHAIGYYRRDQTIGVNEHVRPDSRYGVSKCCGEAIASLYADKYGVSSLVIRIGNGTFDEPADERLLSVWIGKEDLAQLISIGLDHPDLHYEIVYGASGNTRSFWNNETAYRLGYRPQSNAEDYAEALLAGGPIEHPDSPGAAFQGGRFIALP